MSHLILPTEDHYPRMVSQRAIATLANIKAKFNAIGLSEKVENCLFKQFSLAFERKFLGQIIHQLLLRKFRSSNNTEMQFLIGNQILRFGLIEFCIYHGIKLWSVL